MKSKLLGFLAGPLAVSTALVGCGGGGGGGGNSMTIEGTNNSEYATSSVTLPTMSSQFAWDLDGDGNADDRLGLIVGVLNQASPPQTAVDAAVASGQLLVLLKETSTDPTQQKASNAGVTFQEGMKPASPPKYDGTDTFTGTGSVSTFYGNISGGIFTSLDPAHMTTPTEITVGLPLVSGAEPTMLPVTGGRITFTAGADGKITGGQINGALRKTDLDNIVIPSIAALLTTKLMADPSNQTFAMFDTNGDGTITAMEIENNSLLKQFLSADIQMFDHPGTDPTVFGDYHPTPNGSVKDCLSLGLGFTAVKASF